MQEARSGSFSSWSRVVAELFEDLLWLLWVYQLAGDMWAAGLFVAEQLYRRRKPCVKSTCNRPVCTSLVVVE